MKSRIRISCVALAAVVLLSAPFGGNARAQGGSNAPASSGIGAYSMREGFELFEEVMTSECPAQFREVWSAEHDRVVRVSNVWESAVGDYEAQKRALLEQKAFWGGDWHSDEAANWIDRLSALGATAAVFNDVAKLLAPEVQAARGYVVYKLVSKSKDTVYFAKSVKKGDAPLATYQAASALDVIPPEVKPLSDVIAAYYKWKKTRSDFEAYRSELRRALERLDGEIAAARSRMKTAQSAFRDRTKTGIREFCRRPDELVARDDYVSVSLSQESPTCLPVRDNDEYPNVVPDRVRIAAVGVTSRPSGKAQANEGGTCILYQKPSFFGAEMTDEFDYEVRDDSGRRARATVHVTVVACGNRSPLDHTAKDTDPCRKEHAAEDAASRRPQPKTDGAGDSPPHGEHGACPGGLTRVDETCFESDAAETVAAKKCDPELGWGTCSPDERALAEAYGRHMQCDDPRAPIKVPNEQARGYLDRFECVADSRDDLSASGRPSSTRQPPPSTTTTTTTSGGDLGTSPSEHDNRADGADSPNSIGPSGTPSGSGSSPAAITGGSSTGGEGGASPDDGPKHTTADSTDDATGQACSYFTRPAIERSDSLGVKSVSLNYHSNGAVVCQGTSRYRCEAGRWARVGTDCSRDDPKQAWRLEGGKEPKQEDPKQGGPNDDGAGANRGGPQSGSPGSSSGGPSDGGGGPASPFAAGSPFGGGSPFDSKSGSASPGSGASPFSSPYANPANGSKGKGDSHGSDSSQASRDRNGKDRDGGRPNGGPGPDGMVLTRECLAQQSELGQAWKRRCEAGLEGLGMCELNRRTAKCMEEAIEITRNLPCPKEMIDESVNAMRNMMEQARFGARQVCTN